MLLLEEIRIHWFNLNIYMIRYYYLFILLIIGCNLKNNQDNKSSNDLKFDALSSDKTGVYFNKFEKKRPP